MTEADKRFCVDCLFCVERKETGYNPEVREPVSLLVHRCVAPRACVDPVTGAISTGRLCSTLREPGGLCGPEGTMWVELT